MPKASRPVPLLTTVRVVIDSAVARRLSYLVETRNALPSIHIVDGKLASTEHALHIIIGSIFWAWNTSCGKVASLLLKISAVFNVIHE